MHRRDVCPFASGSSSGPQYGAADGVTTSFSSTVLGIAGKSRSTIHLASCIFRLATRRDFLVGKHCRLGTFSCPQSAVDRECAANGALRPTEVILPETIAEYGLRGCGTRHGMRRETRVRQLAGQRAHRFENLVWLREGYRCVCAAVSRSPVTKRTIASRSAARGNLFLSIPALIAPAFDLSKGKAIAK